MKNNEKVIAIFGGTGFLGTHTVEKLCKADFRIKIGTRKPWLSTHLKMGSPGQVELMRTNIFNPEDVKRVLKNCDIAINLVGVLYEKKTQKFHQIHAQFPKLLSELCHELGVKKLIHISALGVKEDHPSKYMQSKLQGEKNIQDTFNQSVILRPGVMFGPKDKFFNRFATLSQFSPVLPLIGGGHTVFEPIYVGDVAEAITKSLELNNSKPIIFELGGDNYSFKELMQILLNEIRKKRFLLSIPWSMAKFQSYILQVLPSPLLTPDQVTLLRYDNVVSGEYKTLKNLKIKPTTIQSILPKYVWRYRTSGQFSKN